MSQDIANDRTSAHAASIYAEADIENAPPLKLVRLLYQGAIRFLDRAAICDPHASGSKFTYWLGRSEDIVVELRLALDNGPAPQLAESLNDLYLFVETQMQNARRQQSTQPLAGARAVLIKLLEAWTAIDSGKI